MKRLGFLLFLAVFMLVFPQTGDASDGSAKIYLDGEQLKLSNDVKVLNIKGSVMIPIRVVSENLGFKVEWDKTSQTVTVTDNSTTVRMTVGSTQADIDGTPVTMNISPQLNKNTTYVPLRFVSKEMGMNIEWDNKQKIVYLTSPPAPEPPAVPLSTVDGISFTENRLMIAVSGGINSNVFKLTGPDRIVVDLNQTRFADTFGTNNILDHTQTGSLAVTDYPDVKGIRYSLFKNDPSTIRVVIELNYAKNYIVQGTEPGAGLLIVDLNTDPAQGETPLPPTGGTNGNKIIVVDAGHGNQDGGAKSVTNKREKDFNLAVALKVAELLRMQNGIDVFMTRSDDTFIALDDRAAIANKLKADVFVSVHGNSSTNAATSGTETYYYQRESSKTLANIIHKHLIAATGFKDRGVKSERFVVVKKTTMPAVLLEVGFLSNKGDEALMFSEDFQYRVAQGIVDGIKEYLKLN